MGRIFGRAAAFLGAMALATMPLAAQDQAQQQAAPPEPPPLTAYGELPGVEDVAISPTGEHLAMIATIEGVRRLLIFDNDISLQNMIGAGDVKFRGIRFAGDEALLFYHSATVDVRGFVADQYELTQAVVVPVEAGEEAEAVFGNTPRLADSVFGTHGIRQVDGRWKGYFGAIEYERRGSTRSYAFNHGRPALYEVDFADMDERRIASSPPEGIYRDWIIGRDGEIEAVFDIRRGSGDWNIRNGEGDRIAEGRNPNGDAGLRGLGSDGTTLIYFVEDTGTGLTDWFELPLAGGQATPFLDEVDVDRLFWNGQTGEFLGYLPEDNPDEPVFFDPELQDRARMIRRAFSGRRARMVEWTADLGRAIVHTEGEGDSGTWYLVDIAARSARDIGYDRPLIRPSRVGPMSRVEYVAEDGLALAGILTLPPGREAVDLPLVVLPHGGPHLHDEIGFDWWAQAFASRGYAVFQPNFRGSTGRGEEFIRAGYGEWGRKMQTDISDGVAHLAAEGIIDPSRACIVGASYGGYAALAGVTVQQGLYRCAVSVAGISDISMMSRVENREAGRSGLFRRSLAEELGPRDEWRAISPRRQAERADAPILLIHGRDDTVVAYDQSRVMADALDDADKPYRFVELEGEDHWLSTSETRLQMLTEAVAFVQEHNPAD